MGKGTVQYPYEAPIMPPTPEKQYTVGSVSSSDYKGGNNGQYSFSFPNQYECIIATFKENSASYTISIVSVVIFQSSSKSMRIETPGNSVQTFSVTLSGTKLSISTSARPLEFDYIAFK